MQVNYVEMPIMMYSFFTVMFFIFIHPVVCLFICAGTERLSGKRKATWALVILLTWSIGNLLFMFSSAPPLRLKVATFLILISGIITTYLTYDYIQKEMPEVRQKIFNGTYVAPTYGQKLSFSDNFCQVKVT